MKNEKFDVYEKITNIIIQKLEEGVAPWKCGFMRYDNPPKNYVSDKPYRGINALLLSLTGKRPIFMTYLQAKELGGNVKKGAKGFPVVYYNFVEKEQENVDKDAKKIPFLRYYTVFSTDDIEGIDFDFPEIVRTENERLTVCEEIIEKMPNAPKIDFASGRAYYSTILDYVSIPPLWDFETREEYYATIFHELGHSTGHESRLAREEVMKAGKFGSYSYSKEELVAEICAAFLCGYAGITQTLDNSVAYIQSWLKVLRNDKKFVIDAASKAQRAFDYILNINFEN